MISRITLLVVGIFLSAIVPHLNIHDAHEAVDKEFLVQSIGLVILCIGLAGADDN